MAELLIFTTDTIGDDVYKNTKLPKRGDVITVQEDGWRWGDEELKDPRFLVLKIPGAAVKEFMHLTSAEVATRPGTEAQTDPVQLINTLQMRGFHIDLDALKNLKPEITPKVTSKQADDGTWQPVSIAPDPVALPDAQTLLSYKIQRPPVDDPAIIGTPNTLD